MSFATALWPLASANWSGVWPLLSFALTFAPFSMRSSTTALWPPYAAQCNGAQPCSLSFALTFAPFVMRRSAIALRPNSGLRKPINETLLQYRASDSWDELLYSYLGD